MRRILLLSLCLLGLLSISARDDYGRRNITMNDGLAANAVRNIVQDKNGYIWFGTDNGLCRYDGRRVLTFRIPELGINQYISALIACDEGVFAGTEKGVFFVSHHPSSIRHLPMDIHTTVTHLSLDKEGCLWVSTMGQGVWQYIMTTGQAKHYDLKAAGNAVAQVLIDNSNQVWTVTNWGEPVVQKLNRLHDQFEPVSLNYKDVPGSLRMLQTKDGRLWLGTWEHGLLLMHNDGTLEPVLDPQQSKVGWHIHTLYELSEEYICIGCDDGVVRLNPKTREWTKFDDRFVYAITSDTEGGLWIGTFYGGVKYISPVGRRFDGFSMDDGLVGNVISRFCEDRHGRIWIASDDGGLICYSPSERRFVSYPHHDLLSKCNVHALCLDDEDNLWIGTYTNGVMVMNPETGRLRQYMHTDAPNSLDNSSSYAIYLDSHGQLWVATMEGLCLYNRETDDFTRIGKTNAITIDIDEDKEGNLWLSTQGEGLWLYERKTRKLLHVQTSLPDNQVNCCHIDQKGNLWIGTFAGLCLSTLPGNNNSLKKIELDTPSQNIMSIIEDNGALWLSTERGIVKYIPNEGVQRFTLHDGLVSEQFQPNSGIKTSDGRIFFGGTSGFNTFYPYQIKANHVMPPVYITSLSILNQEEQSAEGLPLDLTLTKEITIGYGDSKMVSLSFASLSYCSPEKIEYAYMLEGFDHDWNYVGNQNRATYTNLPAGTYHFRVKATNNDGLWSTNEAMLRIIVQPPFWWSWYAKIFYLLLLGGIIWQYVHFRLRREEHRHQREMQRLNEEKEKEVREARLNFFTMIAHEIRTPVSLIIGPLEQLKKASQGNLQTPDSRLLIPSLLDVLDRNAHRLLELVNQLLDFRKVEQLMLVMHFAPQNIHELIRSVSERFAPTFEQGGKQFTVTYPDERFTAIIDREAVIKVISNLLTNANKYTKDDVRLSCIVEPDGEHFRIEVSDNGIGIKPEDQHRIFEPFFQAEGNKPGTGIGLNIVKSIVDQHHGEISVVSELGKGSTFTVVLPVNQEENGKEVKGKLKGSEKDNTEEATDIRPFNSPLTSPQSPLTSLQQTLLIVEDSDDMRDFLVNNFRDQYDVITAGDGIEALHQLEKHQVNIIISDRMMPRMDGAELCRRVRSNQLTSHIPFVMLTAKTDDDSKVEGMDVGADTYIEKPFSVQYLEACIRNILQIRRQLMEKFSTQPLEPVTEIAQNPTDNDFLIRMNKIIEENFSNSDLSVDFLADKLNISRSGLFAKIKTLADVTPNEMIQIVRLKRAAQLLHDGGYLVSEVGYMVGFSNPSYFSKCFQRQFGIRPADYMKSSKRDD